jgi:serine/threonine protein kinase/Leucine-rich repeat (LRR) protein
MPVALEQFVKQLADSGVIAPGKLEKFIPPQAAPKDAQELAKELVRQKHLTKFQAQEIYGGRSKSLILGNYTILDKIGAGGMGQVFKAEHRRMHRLVAIKMLPAAMMRDVAAAARFQREVEAAAKLSHPNIVAAYDADESNGVHFLVMECVEGSDLSALVKKNGPLPVAKAVNYVLQAARGLEFAHGEGVVHRDIKPANLLLDKKGTVKILDMGLARIDGSGDSATQAELTGTGAVLGTVDYMAPEQALSTKHVDGRADIYSLGCSLYYLVTAHAAYDGDSLMAKLLAHREQPIPSLGADVPEDVQAVFQKMVAKKVQDRFQSMTEVVAALEQCSSGQPTSVSLQQSVDTNLDSDVLTFLRDAPPHASHIHKKTKKAAPAKTAKDKKKLIQGAVSAGLLGLVILAGVLLKLRTKDGTLVIEINQPDAVVQVLNSDGKVEISQPGGKGSVTISVDPGKHRLKVEKDGFKFFAKDFEMDSGGTQSIKAKLILEDKPVAAGTKKLLAFKTPGFDQWIKTVAALPAEEQVKAVVKKLQELNPGFDGKISNPGDESSPPFVQDGNVVQLQIFTDKVADLSPILALSELRTLQCNCRQRTGQRLDLSPLNGMRIHNLVSVGVNFDLSTVKGLPLKELTCIASGITSLTPVSGMQLHSLTLSGSWEITSLEPLRGMPLTYLACDNSQVADLSPLSGMPLKRLVCHVTKVADLSPLKGMPLEELSCEQSLITDLSPLAGMKLKRLSFTPNPELKGLQAIRQMDSLVEIGTACDKMISSNRFWKKYDADEFGKPASTAAAPDRKPITNINDPAFQQWVKTVAALPAEEQVKAVAKKLQELNPGFDGKETGGDGKGTPKIDGGVVTEFGFVTDNVTDISPVRALVGLKALNCSGSGPGKGILSELSPLHGMRLSNLFCYYTSISDLSPLRGMPLTQLWCGDTQVSDLSPLQGMPLMRLKCYGTQVSDLSPLKGMKLSEVLCDRSNVSDLSPLQGMPLTILHCGNTSASDLSSLRGMALTDLNCEAMPVSDLSPLEGMNLTEVCFTPKNITRGMNIVRQMKSLRKIGINWDNRLPPAEFWKKYDAGEFGKPAALSKPITNFNDPAFKQWMKDVAALPVEKQVVAVVKKLQELNPGFDGKVTGLGLSGTPKIENGMVTVFGFAADNVTDISPVRAFVGLKSLTCNSFGGGTLSDLSPLQGMPLTELRFGGTQVSDLSPLKGMALTDLWFGRAKIADLSPLKGMPLTELHCQLTQVSDLSPLEGLDLTTLAFTPKDITEGIDVIRQMKSLKTIELDWASGHFPAAEFWKKYDAGEFNK